MGGGWPMKGSMGKIRHRFPPFQDLFGALIMVALSVLAVAVLVLPLVVIVIVSFDTGQILRFPPQAFSLDRYMQILELNGFLDAIRLSAVVALVVVAIDVVLGVPAAISLVRGDFPGKSVVLAFLLSPLMIPGIVIGIAILFFVSFINMGISVLLMTISHVVITLPFMVRVVYARMESADRALEEAAEDLGANRWQVFRYVILPHLLPGIVGGSAFAFLLSFDNLPVSIFTAPLIEPPLPVFLFRLLLYDVDPIVAPIAVLQIVITLVVLLIVFRTLGTRELERQF